MVQPINYLGMIPQVDLGQRFAQGAAIGGGIREMRQAQADRERAEKLRQQYAADLQNALDNPTQRTWSEMIAKYPQQREAFAEARKGFNEDQIKNDFDAGMQISMALEMNNPQIAKQKLQTIITAKQNAGEDVEAYQQIFNALEAGNIKAAQAGTNFALSSLDPDRFQKTVQAQASYVKAPAEARQAVAQADKAIADAEVAQANAATAEDKAQADLDLAIAQAEKAKIESKYTEQNIKADLNKKAADLGLTNAQKNKTLAETRNLGIEMQKAVLELAGLKETGGVDPTKKFDNETKLRDEYQKRTKNYRELDGTYSTIIESAKAKTGPGDIALITSFMKMLDPGSVVRDTEFATARDTAGLYDRLANQAQKFKSGQIFALDSKQRQEYVNLSKQYLDAAKKKAEREKEDLGVVVRNYNLNPDNVFGTERPEPQRETVTVGGKTYARPDNFTDEMWANYKKSVGVE